MANNKTRMRYSRSDNLCIIDAPCNAFVPKYLYYLLEYNQIPKTVKLLFSDSLHTTTLAELLSKDNG